MEMVCIYKYNLILPIYDTLTEFKNPKWSGFRPTLHDRHLVAVTATAAYVWGGKKHLETEPIVVFILNQIDKHYNIYKLWYIQGNKLKLRYKK